ncbi:MAG: hypothetical protein AAGG75_01925 [Bacteroidota bacterium]
MRWLSFVLLAFPICTLAQSPVTAEVFFAQCMEGYEGEPAPIEERISLPWVETYDLRTETRDFDFGQQEYTFRMQPSSGKKRRAQRALSDQLLQLPEAEGREAYCDRLLEAHIDWGSLFFIEQQLQFYQALDTLYLQQERLLLQTLGTNDLDADDWFKLRIKRSEVAIAQQELLLERQLIADQNDLPNSIFDFSNFINTNQIQAQVQEATAAAPPIDPQLAYEKELAQKEIDLEQAEAKQYLDFAQLRYVGPHDDPFRERFSVGLAFRIPNSGNRKIKIQELRLKQGELEQQQKWDQRAYDHRLKRLRLEVLSQIQALLFYRQTIAEEANYLNQLQSTFTQNDGLQPRLLLDIEERSLLNQIEGSKMQEDIFFDYLKYLETAQIFCQQPYVIHFRSE